MAGTALGRLATSGDSAAARLMRAGALAEAAQQPMDEIVMGGGSDAVRTLTDRLSEASTALATAREGGLHTDAASSARIAAGGLKSLQRAAPDLPGADEATRAAASSALHSVIENIYLARAAALDVST